MPEDNDPNKTRNLRPERGGVTRRIPLADTQPTPALSPDDVETGEIPGTQGEPTVARDRTPTGATPTATCRAPCRRLSDPATSRPTPPQSQWIDEAGERPANRASGAKS